MRKENFDKEILSMILLDNATLTALTEDYGINQKMFYVENNGKIFKSMLDMNSRNISIDCKSLIDFMTAEKKIDEVGGAGYIAELCDIVPTTANLDYYAKLFIEDYRRTALNSTLSEKLKDLESGKDTDSIMAGLSEKFSSLEAHETKRTVFHGSELMKVFCDTLDFNCRNKGKIIGFPTGFSCIDDMTRGFRKGELVTVGAIAGCGKTAFAGSIIINALKQKRKVAFFSLEMPVSDIMTRLVSLNSRITVRDLRDGNLNNADFEAIGENSGIFTENLFIVDESGIELSKLRQKIKSLVKVHGVEAIIIDYAQLITISDEKLSGYDTIKKISHSLKSMAKEFEIPLIALAQLNSEAYKDKPKLNNMGGGLALAQDSDYVFVIYRKKDSEGKEDPYSRIVECIKGRNTGTGLNTFDFSPKFARFQERQKTDKAGLKV